MSMQMPRLQTIGKKSTRRGTRRTRGEKSEDIRAALVKASAYVVGKVGYERASIGRITSQAGVAQGTFYNYFTSRQDLFDQLLPALGAQLLEYMNANMPHDVIGLRREEQRLRLYLKYLQEHPWFHRIVNESEVMAPKAHKEYFESLTAGYVQALRRHVERKEIAGYDDSQLETIAYMLLAARIYLPQRFMLKSGLPERVVQTYVQFLKGALFSNERSESGEPQSDRSDKARV